MYWILSCFQSLRCLLCLESKSNEGFEVQVLKRSSSSGVNSVYVTRFFDDADSIGSSRAQMWISVLTILFLEDSDFRFNFERWLTKNRLESCLGRLKHAHPDSPPLIESNIYIFKSS
jgi:hypothetical protein